jgi:molecular chaperone GrpE
VETIVLQKIILSEMVYEQDELKEQPQHSKTQKSSKKTKHQEEELKNDDITAADKTTVENTGGEIDEEESLKAAEEKYNELQDSLKATEEKTKELHDKYLRLSAEFDNYRKRTLREKSELILTASESILKKIIPVVDDLERGLLAVEQAKDIDSLKQGMLLIYGRFKDFLMQQGIKEIDSLNKDFNTDLHEAVSKIPASDEQKGKVVDVVEKGYLLYDKVLRYSRVVVGE